MARHPLLVSRSPHSRAGLLSRNSFEIDERELRSRGQAGSPVPTKAECADSKERQKVLRLRAIRPRCAQDDTGKVTEELTSNGKRRTEASWRSPAQPGRLGLHFCILEWR